MNEQIGDLPMVTGTHHLMSIPTLDHDWLTERSRWTVYYDQYLYDKLVWAIAYILQNRRRPQNLAEHLDSLFVLLDQVHSKSHLELLVMQLIIHLHPWPTRWGRWEIWEEKLRYATDL